MVAVWLLTLPAAATVGALAAWVAARGTGGTVLVGVVLVVASAGIYALSRRTPVTAATVAAATVTELPAQHSPEHVLGNSAAAEQGADPQVGQPAAAARAA